MRCIYCSVFGWGRLWYATEDGAALSPHPIELAGLPALWCSEPGQVRKEAATANYRKCRGKARLLFVGFVILSYPRFCPKICRIKRAKITPVFVDLVQYLATQS